MTFDDNPLDDPRGPDPEDCLQTGFGASGPRAARMRTRFEEDMLRAQGLLKDEQPKAPKRRRTNGFDKKQEVEPISFENPQAASSFLIEKITDAFGPFTYNELGLKKEQAKSTADLPRLARRNRKSNAYEAKRKLAVTTIEAGKSELDVYALSDVIATVESYLRSSKAPLALIKCSSLREFEQSLRQELYTRLVAEEPNLEASLEQLTGLAFVLSGNSVPPEMQGTLNQRTEALRSTFLGRLTGHKADEELQRAAEKAVMYVARLKPRETDEERATKPETEEVDLTQRGTEETYLLGGQESVTLYLNSLRHDVASLDLQKLALSNLAEFVTEVKLAKEIQFKDGSLDELEEQLHEELKSRYQKGAFIIPEMKTRTVLGLAHVLAEYYTPYKPDQNLDALRSDLCKEVNLRLADPEHSAELLHAAADYLTRTPMEGIA